MHTERIEEFLSWCLFVNLGICSITAIAAPIFRSMACRIQKTLSGIEPAAVIQSVQHDLAVDKLLITLFNFVPWAAALIIR